VSSDQRAAQLRALLYSRVGAFFTNTMRRPGFCTVCTAPAAAELCRRCTSHRARYGESLADLVVPLAYVRGRMKPPHQSEHYVWRYKHPVRPSPRCLRDLSLVMLAGTTLHGPCIARTVGWWEVVTFVPSASRPGPEHPVAELARQVAAHSHGVQRILLRPGPGLTKEPLRAPRGDRFTVAPEHLPVITGRHQWEEHRPLIEGPHEPYDALCCPVTDGACPAG
jgi:hypothetical protein